MAAISRDSVQSIHICERSHERHLTPKFHTVTRWRRLHSSLATDHWEQLYSCEKKHVHNRDLCYGRTSTWLQAIKNNELLRRVTCFSTTTDEIFFFFYGVHTVMHACLSEGCEKKWLFTSTVLFVAQENTHTHMHVHTHTLNSFKQMTVITE